MRLTREMKQTVIDEVTRYANGATEVVAAEYTGMNVAEMTKLRSMARAADGVILRVVRNTLARRALESTPYAGMAESLKGPLMLGFSMEAPGALARVIRDFAKANGKPIVKSIALGGELLDPSALEQIANLPTLAEAQAILLRLLQTPHQSMLRLFNEVPLGMVRVLDAQAKQAEGNDSA